MAGVGGVKSVRNSGWFFFVKTINEWNLCLVKVDQKSYRLRLNKIEVKHSLVGSHTLLRAFTCLILNDLNKQFSDLKNIHTIKREHQDDALFLNVLVVNFLTK